MNRHLKRALDRSFWLPRSWSNEVLKRLAPLFSGEVLNVSGWNDMDKEGAFYRDYFENASAYYVSNYGGRRGTDDAETTDFHIDLTAPPDASLGDRFDVVFSHTTLEHIFDVAFAFRNLCAMSRDVVIVVVPFAQEVHTSETYGDYWRFTPMSLRRLFADNGMTVVYEAATPDAQAGVYLLFIGSRKAGEWSGRLPPWQPVESLGGWIGRTWLVRALEPLTWLKRRW